MPAAPPGPLQPTTITTLPAVGGALYAETFVPTVGEPKGVVVITHGYQEHCGRYHEVAHVVANAGWAVLAYDVRGHGQSPGKRGAIDHFDTYLADLDTAVAEGRRLAPGKPLVLLGHSHGGLIVLRALCGDRPPDIKTAIVSSPYLALKLAVPAYKKVLARIATKILPNLSQPTPLNAEDLTHDKQKQAERVADKLCFDSSTARWFTESSAAQDYVAGHADRIKVPTTWFVGGADPIADPSRAKLVSTKVQGAAYHDLVGMRHEVFNEVDRQAVFAELVRALDAAT